MLQRPGLSTPPRDPVLGIAACIVQTAAMLAGKSREARVPLSAFRRSHRSGGRHEYRLLARASPDRQQGVAPHPRGTCSAGGAGAAVLDGVRALAGTERG